MDLIDISDFIPYITGILIGILAIISLLISDKTIGCSTAYVRTSGIIERIFFGKKVYQKKYYKEFKPEIDWEWMLVIGIIIGAFISSVISKTFSISFIPSLWNETFGSSIVIRLVLSIIGGILIGFGARMAGGCTSGHGISGNLQLSVGSWIATICFFTGGIISALIIYSFTGGF